MLLVLSMDGSVSGSNGEASVVVELSSISASTASFDFASFRNRKKATVPPMRMAKHAIEIDLEAPR